MLGQRDTATATAFVSDLASRLSNRVQITTDGHRPYLEAVENAFGMEVDYSILQKIYGSVLENETRYSPAKCIGINQNSALPPGCEMTWPMRHPSLYCARFRIRPRAPNNP